MTGLNFRSTPSVLDTGDGQACLPFYSVLSPWDSFSYVTQDAWLLPLLSYYLMEFYSFIRIPTHKILKSGNAPVESVHLPLLHLLFLTMFRFSHFVTHTHFPNKCIWGEFSACESVCTQLTTSEIYIHGSSSWNCTIFKYSMVLYGMHEDFPSNHPPVQTGFFLCFVQPVS